MKHKHMYKMIRKYFDDSKGEIIGWAFECQICNKQTVSNMRLDDE